MVFAALLAAGLLLSAVAATRQLTVQGRRSLAVVASVPLFAAAVLAGYVFSEDAYRDNGMTRWDAYRSPGGALGPMFVASLMLMVAFAAVIAYAALVGRQSLLRAAAGAAGVTAVLLLIPTALGFTLN